MKWGARAFTIVELVIAITVIAILAAVVTISYMGVTQSSRESAVKSDLQQLATAMETELQASNTYPETIPSTVQLSPHTTLSVVRAGSQPYYTNLSAIQNGVLLSEVCDVLIDDGVGQGTNQDGEQEEYITWCGNWNDDRMQITGWDTQTWHVPVEKQDLLDYATTFEATNAYNSDQERVVETFYTRLIELFEQQGGEFPITSFWDYWATPSNGGVQKVPLDESQARMRPYFCAEAYVTEQPGQLWHITQEEKLLEGSC